MPPVRSGIALDSANLVAALRSRHAIDVFVDESGPARAAGNLSAHEFVSRQRQSPYDLTVYQVGNSSHHHFLWAYAFRYPGLVVLHDAHVHHARAAALLWGGRPSDYRAEFAAAHPDAHPDAAELAVAGFDSYLYYMWPMTRLLVAGSRAAAVHNGPIAEQMTLELGAAVDHIRLSHGAVVSPELERSARGRVRERYRLGDRIVFGVFGGLSRDKRIPQILDAFAALLGDGHRATLLLAGAAATHYDLAADVAARGLTDCVVLTGYVDGEAELTDVIAATDVVLNLRWPTARETSGPWLRALAAGKPTVIIDLLQTVNVPTVDPRSWTTSLPAAKPVAVAIDILDEEHSLRLAMRRLAADDDFRRSLGEAARRHWQAEHSFEAMVADYERVMARAGRRPAPSPALPPHLRNRGEERLEELLMPFGVRSPLEQGRL